MEILMRGDKDKPKPGDGEDPKIYKRPDGGSGNQTGHAERSKANDPRPDGHNKRK